jgi:CBS domain-containing protein
MQVTDVMTKEPLYVCTDANLQKISEEMKRLDCGIIPVGDGEKLLGIVTDRDIVIRAIAEGKSPDKTTANEIMTPDVWYCFENDKIEDAANSMKVKKVKRLIVLNNDKKLVGLISLSDISTSTSANEILVGEVVERLSA